MVRQGDNTKKPRAEPEPEESLKKTKDAEKTARQESDNTMPETLEKTVVQQDDNTMNRETSEARRGETADGTEHLDDAKRCRHCGEDAVVPIKDKQFESIHRRGNPYRQTCLSCGKHICMCSREFWEEHPDRFVMESEIADATPVFDCPECGGLVEGYPDECPMCGVEYEW